MEALGIIICPPWGILCGPRAVVGGPRAVLRGPRAVVGGPRDAVCDPRANIFCFTRPTDANTYARTRTDIAAQMASRAT